ncbi:phosphoribosyltransferase [Burkholderiales bacterium GJ-E10]|nr:phosphoribosyltransferase [Burkholderiales bacterium GJ-E10]
MRQADEEVRIGPMHLPGILATRTADRGLVVFVHGSGSSRFSPRNAVVAQALQELGLGTLLFDLLSEREGSAVGNVFDIHLLASRLLEALAWVAGRDGIARLPIGLFGASTGAAAAIRAAAARPDRVAALVSRGGRPDLAADHLAKVRAPTLLIVGERDREVLRWNREAADMMTCEKRLVIVPRATHLFEEAGALETVADLAGQWFLDHLAHPARAQEGRTP